MDVVRGDAPRRVPTERGIDARVPVDEAGRQGEEERGVAVLELADGEVVVPDAVGAVVGEQEERGVCAQRRLDLAEEGAEVVVERRQPVHEVLVRRHQVHQPKPRLRRVRARKVADVPEEERVQVGAVDALPPAGAQERERVGAALRQLGLAERLPDVVVRHRRRAEQRVEELARRRRRLRRQVAAAVVDLLAQERCVAAPLERRPHRLPPTGVAARRALQLVVGEAGVHRHHVRDRVVADRRELRELVQPHRPRGGHRAERAEGARAHPPEVSARGRVDHQHEHAQRLGGRTLLALLLRSPLAFLRDEVRREAKVQIVPLRSRLGGRRRVLHRRGEDRLFRRRVIAHE